MATVRQSQYSQVAVKALNADSASYAVTASHALNSGGSPVTIKDEGSTLTTGVTSIDFVGDGVTATNIGSEVTVTIPGGGGGSVNTSSLVTTSSFNAYTASINSFTSSINTFTASYNTGSFTGSFTGSLLGTSSYALSASYAPFTPTDTSSLLVTASLSSSILVFEKGDTTTFNIPFNDFDFSLNFISAVSYSIILPYSYSIDTFDNPDTLTVTISSSGTGYTTGSVINPFATTVVEVGTYGFINLNCTKLQ